MKKYQLSQKRSFSKKHLLSQKGQLTFEFLVSLIALLAIFVLCLFIYEDRSQSNYLASAQWNAQTVADTLAREINAVYLADENTSFSDVVMWDSPEFVIDYGTHSVRVWWNSGSFVSSPLLAAPQSLVTDYNGTIIFTKRNGVVTISYS